MKFTPLLCILCLLLLANTCKKKDMAEAALTDKTWLHSYEEDQGDTIVYRPNTYDFPPSRGRTGFALEPGGIIKRYEIAPTDGLQEHLGSWQHKEKNLLQVQMQDDTLLPQSYVLEIISLENDVLVVKQHRLHEEK